MRALKLAKKVTKDTFFKIRKIIFFLKKRVKNPIFLELINFL